MLDHGWQSDGKWFSEKLNLLLNKNMKIIIITAYNSSTLEWHVFQLVWKLRKIKLSVFLIYNYHWLLCHLNKIYGQTTLYEQGNNFTERKWKFEELLPNFLYKRTRFMKSDLPLKENHSITWKRHIYNKPAYGNFPYGTMTPYSSFKC